MNIAFSVLVVAVLMIVVEVARPGRAWPRVAGWWRRAALLNVDLSRGEVSGAS